MLLKKKESRLPGAIKDIVMVVIGFVILWTVFHYFIPNGSPLYVVSSGSMVPTLNINDILIVGDSNLFNNLTIGDIIVFHRPAGEDRIIVHRVYDIQNDPDGKRVITTKGDVNDNSIPGTDFPVRENNFIGKVKFVIPQVGVISTILKPTTMNIIILAFILSAILILIASIMRRKRHLKRIN